MATKRVIGIFLILAAITAVIFLFYKIGNEKKSSFMPAPIVTPTVTDKLKEKFGSLIIPEDTTKIELQNVSGGGEMGVATKTEVLADLPELAKGEKYQVLLGNGTKTILLGYLKETKGGWILEYDISKYVGFNQIVIARNSREILKGSF